MDLASLQNKYPVCHAFKFGDSEVICQQLLSLVRDGKKRATCGSLAVYQSENLPMPEVGHVEIALNWDGSPAFAIEMTEVTIRRYCDIDASFALAEGENDTLEGWQADHRAFFERNGGFNPQMELVCQRFLNLNRICSC